MKISKKQNSLREDIISQNVPEIYVLGSTQSGKTFIIAEAIIEYAENHDLGAALCLYAYEADVVALLIAADEQYSLFPPNITCMVNREVIGVVTKCDKADPARAEKWLRLSGCETVYKVDSKTGKGINQVLEHLKNHKKPKK